MLQRFCMYSSVFFIFYNLLIAFCFHCFALLWRVNVFFLFIFGLWNFLTAFGSIFEQIPNQLRTLREAAELMMRAHQGCV